MYDFCDIEQFKKINFGMVFTFLDINASYGWFSTKIKISSDEMREK